MKRIEYPILEQKTLKDRILWPFKVIYAAIEILGGLFIILYPAYQLGLWLFMVIASGSWVLFIGTLSCLLALVLWLAFYTSLNTRLVLIFAVLLISGAIAAPLLSRFIS